MVAGVGNEEPLQPGKQEKASEQLRGRHWSPLGHSRCSEHSWRHSVSSEPPALLFLPGLPALYSFSK